MTFIPAIGETGPLTGPLAIGHMFETLLVGVLAMQVQSYYFTFPNDKLYIKWLVGVVFALEVVFTIFIFINAWATFGPGWGNVEKLEVQHWSLVPIPPLSGITASIVQFFFAYRIFKLTDSWYLPIIICLISALQCVTIFYVGITNAVRGRKFTVFYELSTFISIWLVGDAVCDTLIAIGTVTILVCVMKKSHFRNTKTTLKRLIMLSVETGLITASAATIELVLWQAEKYLNYHYIFFFILGKLHSNAMMAALNSRIQGRLASQGNMNTTISGVNTRAHYLTLFADEYPESFNESIAPASVDFMSNVAINIRRHPGVEMATIAIRTFLS